MMKAYENVFDRLASCYTASQRLSPSCALWVVDHIMEQSPTSQLDHLVDIGGGEGYFCSMILHRTGVQKCTLVDISKNMLTAAKQRFAGSDLWERVWLIQGDAQALPLRSNSAPLCFMSFVLHLLSNPRLALSEIRRVVLPEGRFFLLTYDPQDLQGQIYHRYFPGYSDINLKRFPNLDTLANMLENCGLMPIEFSKKAYEIEYENVDEIISLIRNKPFSALTEYNDAEFIEGLRIFGNRIRAKFGQGQVVNKGQITLVSAFKSGS